MKKSICLGIIFCFVFLLTSYGVKSYKETDKKPEKKYWAEATAEILEWKELDQEIKIRCLIQNHKGNIAIEDYDIIFLITYTDASTQEYHYRYSGQGTISVKGRKIKKIKIPLDQNKPVESISITKFKYDTVNPRKRTEETVFIVTTIIFAALLFSLMWNWMSEIIMEE